MSFVVATITWLFEVTIVSIYLLYRDRMYRDYGNHADANLLLFIGNIGMLVDIT